MLPAVVYALMVLAPKTKPDQFGIHFAFPVAWASSHGDLLLACAVVYSERGKGGVVPT
jgi:hypothetical protein